MTEFKVFADAAGLQALSTIPDLPERYQLRGDDTVTLGDWIIVQAEETGPVVVGPVEHLTTAYEDISIMGLSVSDLEGRSRAHHMSFWRKRKLMLLS